MDLRRWRFFNNDSDDSRFLTEWHDAPLTYHPGQVLRDAHTDHYEERVAAVADIALFEKAADHLLQYHFYPSNVMIHTSDFGLTNRHMCVGDRIVQRIHVIPNVIDIVTMNELISVVDEPRHAGFAYVTTDKHDEAGQWSAQVLWRADTSLWLTIDAYGRPTVPWFARSLARHTQLRAHQRGIAHYKQLIAS